VPARQARKSLRALLGRILPRLLPQGLSHPRGEPMIPAVTDQDTRRAPEEAIERREGLPYREIARDYLRRGRPVIVPGAVAHWPALGRWTPRFFQENYGQKELTIEGRPYRMAEFIDSVERSDAANPAPYLFALIVEDEFPELLPDITP